MADSIITEKRKVLLNTPHLVTPTPARLHSFNTDMTSKLKECKVYFEPVQAGSGDPSPDNVRAITGWNRIIVIKRGKMLIPEDDPNDPQKNYYPSAAGRIQYDSEEGAFIHYGNGVEYPRQWYFVTNSNRLFQANSNITVTFSIDYKESENGAYSYPIRFTKNGKTVANMPNNKSWKHYSTTLNLVNGDYLGLTIYGGEYWKNLRLDYGDEDLLSTPYKGQNISVDWETEAGTIYGGYVDLVRGVVVKEWAEIKLDQVSWTLDTAGYSHYFHKTLNIDESSTELVYCSCYTPIQNNLSYSKWRSAGGYVPELSVGFLTTHKIAIKDNTYSSAADFKDSLTGQVVIYKLATPVTYQLDPITLKTLRGQNCIWSDANGNIELSYWTH